MRNVICMILVLISSFVNAHESEELVTLRAANDALTLRVAQLLEENSRLQAFTEEVLITQSQGKRVSRGCDPQDLRRVLVESSNSAYPPAIAKNWVKENADKCSKQDLDYIKRNVGKWSSYSFGEVIRLADYYIDQK